MCKYVNISQGQPTYIQIVTGETNFLHEIKTQVGVPLEIPIIRFNFEIHNEKFIVCYKGNTTQFGN